jgi:hypothetical protein
MPEMSLTLSEELIAEVAQVARERGETVARFVERALRQAVTAPPGPRRTPFRLELPSVRGRRSPAVDLTSREALYEWMEGRH